MRKSNVRRCLQALIEKNKVLLVIWLLFWPIALISQFRSFSLGNAFAQLFSIAVLTKFLWDDFLGPCCELLIKKALIERTVHVNYAKTCFSKAGTFTAVKTCEIREGLSYHKPILDDMIINKRLTIGYLPKACVILYVEKPKD
ncbi:MAG: hypothetical protein IJA83_02280 [Clostridia bacterium]|nr:hypothetical protein [Clostridia bacterium]